MNLAEHPTQSPPDAAIAPIEIGAAAFTATRPGAFVIEIVERDLAGGGTARREVVIKVHDASGK